MKLGANVYKYKIFGLYVLSDFKMNCYKADFDKEDVRIKLDTYLENDDIKDGFSFVDVDVCAFNIKDLGCFNVSNGNTILISIIPGVEERLVELFTLGTAFGAIMIQKNNFPLHGSVVTNGSETFAIVGESGAGKTTLAAAFANRGWKIVTDDVVRLVEKDGMFHVNSSYPSQKIWRETANKLGLDITKSDLVRNRFDKFYYEFRERFFDKSIQLDSVIEIVKCEVENVKIEELNKRDSLGLLIRNTYRYEIIEASGTINLHFSYMADVNRKIKCYKIRRPIKGFSVNEQINCITNFLGDRDENFRKE